MSPKSSVVNALTVHCHERLNQFNVIYISLNVNENKRLTHLKDFFAVTFILQNKRV